MVGWKRKALLLLMLLALTGGQWAVLQSVAWAGMLASRLRTQRLPDAITTTFDGQHPCPLCKVVQTGRKNESKPEAVIKLPRIEFPLADCGCQMIAELDPRWTVAWSDEFAESLAGSPLVRPPRSLFL
jgi:hypothetical protein